MKRWLKRKIQKNARNTRLTYLGLYAYYFGDGNYYRCLFWLTRKLKFDNNGRRCSAWQINIGGYWLAYDVEKCGYRKAR